MPEKDELANPEVDAQGNPPVPGEPQEPMEPEATTPDDTKGKRTPEPKDWEQEYKTLHGRHQKLQTDFDDLKKKDSGVSEVKAVLQTIQTQIEQHGETLTFVTDVLGSMSELSDEQTARLEANKKAREQATKDKSEAMKTYQQMGQIAQIVKLEPADESLKPAWDAYQKKDYGQAIELTRIAVQTKVSALIPSSPTEPKEPKEPEKKPPKVITKTPAASSHWRDLPPGESKIKYAIEHKET